MDRVRLLLRELARHNPVEGRSICVRTHLRELDDVNGYHTPARGGGPQTLQWWQRERNGCFRHISR